MTGQLKDFLPEGMTVGTYDDWYLIPEGTKIAENLPVSFFSPGGGQDMFWVVYPSGLRGGTSVAPRSKYFTEKKFWEPDPMDENNHTDRVFTDDLSGDSARVVFNEHSHNWLIIAATTKEFASLRGLLGYYGGTLSFDNEKESE